MPPTDGERENAFQLGMFGGQEDLQTIVMTSADKEQFRCTLPKVVCLYFLTHDNLLPTSQNENNQKDNSETYNGPTVLGLLEKIFTQQSCAYRCISFRHPQMCTHNAIFPDLRTTGRTSCATESISVSITRKGTASPSRRKSIFLALSPRRCWTT